MSKPMETTEREEDRDLATRPKKEEPKICPILSLRRLISEGNCCCLRKQCALWVEGHRETVHPFVYLVYEGCGLISEIFWERRKRETATHTKTH